MKNFEKAMVGLDLTEMDDILLPKVVNLINILGIKKVYFIHVAKDLALPEDLKHSYPDLLAPADESIKAEIISLLKTHKFPDEVEYEIEVNEGNPMDLVLRWAKIKDVDLMIMGRKKELAGSGSLAKDMAQKAPCSVLFLSEKAPVQIPKKVLIPMDFSEHSKFTLEFAEKVSKEIGAEILGLHLYQVPTGYYKTGKSHEEFSEIMKGHAQKEYEKFIQKYNFQPFDCLFVLQENGVNEGRQILAYAQKENVGMILMGSRGRTSSAAILLGSVAEKLVQINNEIPMLIFKNKGESMSFFDAILRL